MPAWHQLVPMPEHVEESETAWKLNYARLPSSYLYQLDYLEDLEPQLDQLGYSISNPYTPCGT